jgi:hypothetical protein
LRRSTGQQRFRHHGKASRKRSVVRQVGVTHARADPHAAIRHVLDRVELRQMIDVDQTARLRNSAFHQVQQIGAPREISCAWLGRGSDGLGDRRGPEIFEGPHAACFRSSSPIAF